MAFFPLTNGLVVVVVVGGGAGGFTAKLVPVTTVTLALDDESSSLGQAGRFVAAGATQVSSGPASAKP